MGTGAPSSDDRGSPSEGKELQSVKKQNVLELMQRYPLS